MTGASSLPGINDDYSGTAPDVGAFEYISAFSPTISGNAGIGGALLSYDNGGPKTVTADVNGDYSFKIPNGWSGTVTPSKPGYTFSPVNRAYNTVIADMSGEDYIATPGAVLKLQVRSQGAYDGWILESTETSGKGGTMNASAASFQLGDDAGDRQYRAILSFNTSGLPDNATITSAVIRIEQKAAPTGVNPFSVLGTLFVDVRAPYFRRRYPAIDGLQQRSNQDACRHLQPNAGRRVVHRRVERRWIEQHQQDHADAVPAVLLEG